MQETTFRRHLGYFDAIMIVMGGMIGAGIFLNPAFVAQSLPSASLVILAWIIGGAIAFIGALIFAELGAFLPKVGGQYVYLREGVHPVVGFLDGWGLFWVISTGSIAFLSVMTADYALTLFGIDKVYIKPLAALFVISLSAINYVGIRWGTLVQNFFMVLKLLALFVLIGFGLFFSLPSDHVVEPATKVVNYLDLSILSLMGVALVPVLFSYGGWQNCNNIAEEVREPQRIIPVAVIWGTFFVIIFYILVNMAYLRVLGLNELAASSTPAADTMKRLVGPVGEKLITLGIVLSTLGITNLVILASPRVYFPAIRDNHILERAGRLHPRYQTPTLLIIAQAVWSILLIFLGTYQQLLGYIVFADWLFFALTAWALFVFRIKYPDKPRPFRAWGYPVLPAIFLIFSCYIVVNTFVNQFQESMIGLVLLLSGVPVYYIKAQSKRH